MGAFHHCGLSHAFERDTAVFGCFQAFEQVLLIQRQLAANSIAVVVPVVPVSVNVFATVSRTALNIFSQFLRTLSPNSIRFSSLCLPLAAIKSLTGSCFEFCGFVPQF